jgi:hypothetical protein
MRKAMREETCPVHETERSRKGFPEHEGFRALRGTVFPHYSYWLADEFFSVFLGIGDGGGGQDELGFSSIAAKDPPKTPDEQSHVAPKKPRGNDGLRRLPRT